MAMKEVQNKYLEDSIMTATPQQLTLMLYNGCIKNMNVAKKAIEDKDMQQANKNLMKAQDIIYEFQRTLDMKIPISEQLDALYTFILQCLLEANIRKELEPLQNALELVTELRDTWFQAMKSKSNGTVG